MQTLGDASLRARTPFGGRMVDSYGHRGRKPSGPGGAGTANRNPLSQGFYVGEVHYSAPRKRTRTLYQRRVAPAADNGPASADDAGDTGTPTAQQQAADKSAWSNQSIMW
ncbi:uncharacterized protein LOC117645032 [Thrips palmi]|uniref:Uncharacterized protein LOC117645032 n=1 Tax=Thrips palmi TaxID=161013 RepID=A0A6P8YTL8_THRPL|nr:uncharacterized protein LOC117645032 [Thrips palmi]